MVKLSRPCEAPTAYGKTQLQTTNKGIVPQGFVCNRSEPAHPGTSQINDPLSDPDLAEFRQQFESARKRARVGPSTSSPITGAAARALAAPDIESDSD